VAATDTHLAGLSDDQRLALESWLVELDLSWDEGRLGLWVRRLPPRGDCLRHPALVEMIKIDLERRWQRGQRANLEAYVKSLPELGPLDRLPAHLVLAEYEAREQCGAPTDLAEFARRFPGQAVELRRLIEQRDAEASRAPTRAAQQTLRPGEQATDPGDIPSSASEEVPPSRGAVPIDRPTPMPDQGGLGFARLEWLGRYHILRELGRGAMGTVYLALDTQLDRRVALKIPLFSAADGPEMRQRFLSEARAAATLEHPNICPVFDVGEINGIPYLTMAYLQGRSLEQFLEDAGPLSECQAASLVRQLTVPLQAAHERGIIHRDLKPSNILINPRGEPVLLDFGLARRLRQPGARLTQTGQPVGTPAYMAPEQVAGDLQRMGPGCDIYALGVILYQLLTGRLPFEGSVAEVLAQIVAQPPEPPSNYRPSLDAGLEAICLKALDKKVANRYASMQELGTALADYLGSNPPPAPRGVDPGPAAVSRAARPRTRWLARKPLWLLVGGAGLAALVLLAIFLWGTPSSGTTRIELNDPLAEVEVQVDGEPIDRATLQQPLQLRPGKHHLLITGKKIEPFSTSFTVAPGTNPVLLVSLVRRANADPQPSPKRSPDHRERRHHREDDDDDD
jgi:hypothetical protein